MDLTFFWTESLEINMIQSPLVEQKAKGMSSNCGPNAAPGLLYLSFNSLPQPPWKSVTPILQKKKLRPMEVSEDAQGHKASK